MDTAGATVDDLERVAEEPAEHTVLGDYRIAELLGQGAMGQVYRAYDPRLDRWVALKLVHPRRLAADPAIAHARLLAEARALARIHHPNVLAVYDVGTRDDVVFVALAMIEGTDLSLWLMQSPRSWHDVVQVFAEAAAGLTAVHGAGIVHRDIKPANILVERSAAGLAFGRVLIADFGIARATAMGDAATRPAEAEADASDEPSITDTGRVLGTPVYMAPEQHVGGELGPAADQYALCVALYEALYGRRPFRGNAHALLQAKLQPPAMPARTAVPAWVWRIVRRGLSPRAEDRFASLAALESALRSGGAPRRRRAVVGLAAMLVTTAGLAGLAAPTRCDRLPAELREIWSEHRSASIAAAFASDEDAALRWSHASEDFDRYADALATAHRDACNAADAGEDERVVDRWLACLRERWLDLSGALALLETADPDLLSRADDLADSLDSIETCTGPAGPAGTSEPPTAEQRERVAEVRRLRADAKARQAVGRFDDAARSAYAALELARAVGYAPALAEALATVGEIRERQSRLEEARAALEEAIIVGIEAGHDRPVMNAAIGRTWIAAEYDRDVDAAEHWASLARAQLARLGHPVVPTLALHNALGTAYLRAGRLRDAAHEFEIGLAQASSDPESAGWAATLHSNLGGTRVYLGEFALARESITVALELFRAQLAPDDPAIPATEIRLAQVLDLEGRHGEAVARLRSAIAELERLQSTPSEIANALVALGLALRNAGLDDESFSTHRRAVELLEPTGDGATLAHALVAYGNSCVDRGVYDAAEGQFTRAAALLEPLDPTSSDLGRAWIGLGRIRELQGRNDLALPLYNRAYQAAAPGTRAAAVALVAIARVHTTSGRYDEAFAALDRHDEILGRAGLVLRDDRLAAAIARVQAVVQADRVSTSAGSIATLGQLLDEAREHGSRRLGEGDLALGLAALAGGDRPTAQAALRRAIDELRPLEHARAIAQARVALGECERTP